MIEANNTERGHVSWIAPSNLAIVKYWGKYGNQIPRNPSISLTLSKAITTTSISYSKKEKGQISLDFLFENERQPKFEQRIKKYLMSIEHELSYLQDYHLEINSKNSFPHSSGIASSASSMAALALCLNEIEEYITKKPTKTFLQQSSHLARLGSGSASRSVFPYAAIWGEHEKIQGSSDSHAIGFNEVAKVFKNYHDDILIVSSSEKTVSSSAGHQLMEGNVYASARYQQAFDNCERLYAIMKEGNLSEFIKIAEDEALTLHALMMSSNPSYILLEANSLEIIKRIRAFRNDTSIPICFSIDAGPNIHVLYPDDVAETCKAFIADELEGLCEQGVILEDEVGIGPIQAK